MLVLAALMVVTGTVSLGGLLLDDRLLDGQPIWAKPFKFSVSIALYAVAWAWMAALTTVAPRLVRTASVVAAGFLGVEMVLIVGQVLRGKASHFNTETDLDALLWRSMGIAIGVVWVGTLVLTALLIRSTLADGASRWAARLGALISLAGMAVAFLMTTPTAAQLDTAAGERRVRLGAHAVGVVDGGPGVPILGWSTTGGDLRVPHFIGMHALQVLPLLAIALTALAARWAVLRTERVRTRLVCVAAAGYLGLTALVTWQALREQSIVAPDGLTLLAFGVLVGGVSLGAAWALRSGPSDADSADSTSSDADSTWRSAPQTDSTPRSVPSELPGAGREVSA